MTVNLEELQEKINAKNANWFEIKDDVNAQVEEWAEGKDLKEIIELSESKIQNPEGGTERNIAMYYLAKKNIEQLKQKGIDWNDEEGLKNNQELEKARVLYQRSLDITRGYELDIIEKIVCANQAAMLGYAPAIAYMAYAHLAKGDGNCLNVSQQYRDPNNQSFGVLCIGLLELAADAGYHDAQYHLAKKLIEQGIELEKAEDLLNQSKYDVWHDKIELYVKQGRTEDAAALCNGAFGSDDPYKISTAIIFFGNHANSSNDYGNKATQLLNQLKYEQFEERAKKAKNRIPGIEPDAEDIKGSIFRILERESTNAEIQVLISSRKNELNPLKSHENTTTGKELSDKEVQDIIKKHHRSALEGYTQPKPWAERTEPTGFSNNR